MDEIHVSFFFSIISFSMCTETDLINLDALIFFYLLYKLFLVYIVLCKKKIPFQLMSSILKQWMVD